MSDIDETDPYGVWRERYDALARSVPGLVEENANLRRDLDDALTRALVAEQLADELQAEADRFAWFFGKSDRYPFLSTYITGVKEFWTLDQWRAAIDAAMKEPSNGT